MHKIKSWQRGRVLQTPTTKLYTKEEIKRNNEIENKYIYSDFTTADSGRGRRLVCQMNEHHPDYEKNAELIALAPDMLQWLKMLHDQQWIENTSNEAKRQMYDLIRRNIQHIDDIESMSEVNQYPREEQRITFE